MAPDADYARRTQCKSFMDSGDKCRKKQKCVFSHTLVDTVRLIKLVGDISSHAALPREQTRTYLKVVYSAQYPEVETSSQNGVWDINICDGGPISISGDGWKNELQLPYPILCSQSGSVLKALRSLETDIYGIPTSNPVEYGDPQTTLCKRYLEGHCRATSKNPCRNSHVLFDTKRVEDIAGGAARQTLASVSLHVEYMRGNIKASRDNPGWRLSLCYNSNCTPSLDAIVVDNKDLNTAMYMMEMQFKLQRSLDNLPRAVPTLPDYFSMYKLDTSAPVNLATEYSQHFSPPPPYSSLSVEDKSPSRSSKAPLTEQHRNAKNHPAPIPSIDLASNAPPPFSSTATKSTRCTRVKSNFDEPNAPIVTSSRAQLPVVDPYVTRPLVASSSARIGSAQRNAGQETFNSTKFPNSTIPTSRAIPAPRTTATVASTQLHGHDSQRRLLLGGGPGCPGCAAARADIQAASTTRKSYAYQDNHQPSNASSQHSYGESMYNLQSRQRTPVTPRTYPTNAQEQQSPPSHTEQEDAANASTSSSSTETAFGWNLLGVGAAFLAGCILFGS